MKTIQFVKTFPLPDTQRKREKDTFSQPSGYSYPDHYEILVDLPRVGLIKVRPILSKDASMFEAFFNVLTPHSIYLRFFSYLKQLSPYMLKRLTQIDYDQEIALIALLQDENSEKIIGDARVIEMPPGNRAEFSILVSDGWQGKGIGACLLQHCFAIARQRNFIHIHGIVLAENRGMLALGRKLNFTIKRTFDPTEYEFSKTLSQHGKNIYDSCCRS